MSNELDQLKELDRFNNKVAMFTLALGDIEGYFFDWDSLNDERKEQLKENHFFELNKWCNENEKQTWLNFIKPFALIGHSIPPDILDQIDLSAPHEGMLFKHILNGGVLYCSNTNDNRLAIMSPEAKQFEFRVSAIRLCSKCK